MVLISVKMIFFHRPKPLLSLQLAADAGSPETPGRSRATGWGVPWQPVPAPRPGEARGSRGCRRALARWASPAECHLLPRRERRNRLDPRFAGAFGGRMEFRETFGRLTKSPRAGLGSLWMRLEKDSPLRGLRPSRGGRRSPAQPGQPRCGRDAGQGATNCFTCPQPTAQLHCTASQPVVRWRFRCAQGQPAAKNLAFPFVFCSFLIDWVFFLMKKRKEKSSYPSTITPLQNQTFPWKIPLDVLDGPVPAVLSRARAALWGGRRGHGRGRRGGGGTALASHCSFPGWGRTGPGQNRFLGTDQK